MSEVRLLRGKTHIETVYLTLLEQVLNRNMSWENFLDYFLYYVYRSFVLPIIITDGTGEREKMFITYLKKACERVLGDKSEFCPEFSPHRGDPYLVCVEELNSVEKLRELGFEDYQIRHREAQRKVEEWCKEMIYQASMGLLMQYKMIS